jgi:hypothetical protein
MEANGAQINMQEGRTIIHTLAASGLAGIHSHSDFSFPAFPIVKAVDHDPGSPNPCVLELTKAS